MTVGLGLKNVKNAHETIHSKEKSIIFLMFKTLILISKNSNDSEKRKTKTVHTRIKVVETLSRRVYKTIQIFPWRFDSRRDFVLKEATH